VDQSALNSFNLALEAVFQADRLPGLPGSSIRHAGSGQAAILERIFREGVVRGVGWYAETNARAIETLRHALRIHDDAVPSGVPAPDDGDTEKLPGHEPAGGVEMMLMATFALGFWSNAVAPAENRRTPCRLPR
jgi:hypothetical protein